MFKRILVANRGEIARRVIRACKSLGAKPVAVYSDVDKNAGYLNEADDAICIGPAPAAQSYLLAESLFAAADKTECQAIHPGYGFLAENARFAERCENRKLTFIGPTASHIRLMGDKATARSVMAKAHVQGIPGSAGLVASAEEAVRVATKIGYPVLLKATAGGGGKGMRLVHSLDEMALQFSEASAEAQNAFGNGGLYIEKFIKSGHHIEFQILGDAYGNLVHLGERECSIQRKSQKLIEESPSPFITIEKRNSIGEEICTALRRIGYQNAGTVELLFDDTGNHYFMEMNTRIQVEHGVTELVTGLDLVAWQIRIAAGERLKFKQDDVKFTGAAIECRINAEDPSDNFKPHPGKITKWLVPKNSIEGPIRIDTHIAQGDEVSPYYDSMLAKVLAHGKDRADALARMYAALGQMKVEGIPTTLSFHKSVLQNPNFMAGHYSCSFVEENMHGEGNT